MKLIAERDPSTVDLWLTGRKAGKALLGVQVPHGDPCRLALFWRGYIRHRHVQQIMHDVEDVFSRGAGQYVLGTLFGYGASKKVIGPVAKGLYEYLDEKSAFANFDAYRAEFAGSMGKFVLWANVTEGADLRSMEEDGDNVGISTSLPLFDGAARFIIIETLRRSQDIDRETAQKWLTTISKRVREEQRKIGRSSS
jgi:hypothetical protein